MSVYKKHIALFFTMLFLVSQFAYVGHFLFDSHHNHFEHKITLVKKSNENSCKAQTKKLFSSNDFYNCFICQQHQSLELYQTATFAFNTKNNSLNNNENFNYTNPHFYNSLLQHPSLRAPPSVS